MAGTEVLIGSDADASVVLINRGDTCEQAIVRNDSVAVWKVFDRSDIDASYRLALAASGILEAQVTPMVRGVEPEQPVDGSRFIVSTGRSYRAAWSVDQLQASGSGTQSFNEPAGDLIPVVASEFPAPRQLPTPVPTVPPRFAGQFASMSTPQAVNLDLYWERFGHDIGISSQGLHRTTIAHSIAQDSTAEWSAGTTTPQWVRDAWEPVPAVRAYAASHGTPTAEAVIIELASMTALGVRVAGETTWYAVNRSESAPAATALARWLGLPDADTVTVFTDPRQVRLSTVTNAVQSSVTVEPVGTISHRPRRGADLSGEAQIAWNPTTSVRVPQLEKLPDRLRINLSQAFQPTVAWSQLEIGAHVEQLVTVETGHEWRYERNLAAGQTEARRANGSTGYLFDSGAIDREGHFGTSFASCNYCGGTTCAVCIDKAVACDACAVNICKRCISEPHANLWLCPACSAMRPRPEVRPANTGVSCRHDACCSVPMHCTRSWSNGPRTTGHARPPTARSR